MIFLLDHVNGNAVGIGYEGRGTERQLIIYAEDLDGGSVSVETSFDNENWVPIDYNGDSLTFSQNISVTCPKIAQGAFVRASVNAGEGNPTNVSVFWG